MKKLIYGVLLGMFLSGCASSERLVRLTSRDPVASYKAPLSERLQQSKWQDVVKKTDTLRAKALLKNGQTDLFEETDVNIWPFFTRSNLYTSILWPFIDYDPYGMAIRPFYNQEGDEYSVLFPLSAWNPVAGDGWVLNTFWDKYQTVVVPLGAWGKTSGFLLNCYWDKNSRKGLDILGVFPLFHYSPTRLWAGPFTKSEHSVAFLPLFYYSNENGKALNVLIFSQFNRGNPVKEQDILNGSRTDFNWILLYFNGSNTGFQHDRKLNSQVIFYLPGILSEMEKQDQKAFQNDLPRLNALLKAIGIDEKAPESPAEITAFRRMISEKYGKIFTSEYTFVLPMCLQERSADLSMTAIIPLYVYSNKTTPSADVTVGELSSKGHSILLLFSMGKSQKRIWKYGEDSQLNHELTKLYQQIETRRDQLQRILADQYRVTFRKEPKTYTLNQEDEKHQEESFAAIAKNIGLTLKYPQTPQECDQITAELVSRYTAQTETRKDFLFPYIYSEDLTSESQVIFPLWFDNKEFRYENGEKHLTERYQMTPFLTSFTTKYNRYLSDRNAEKALEQLEKLENCDVLTPEEKRAKLVESLKATLAKLPGDHAVPENLLAIQALREKLQQRYQYEEKKVSNILFPLLSGYSESTYEKSLWALLGGLYYFSEETIPNPALGLVETDLSPLLLHGRQPVGLASKEYNHMPLLFSFSGGKTYLEYKTSESAQKIAAAKAQEQFDKVLAEETIMVESGRRMFLLGSYVDSYYGDNYKFNLLGLVASGYSNSDSSEFSIFQYFYRYRRNASGKAWMIFPFVSCKTGQDKSKFSFLWRFYSQETRGDKSRYHLFFIPFGDELSEETE